jgi:hypothetical protein
VARKTGRIELMRLDQRESAPVRSTIVNSIWFAEEV